MPRPLRAGNKLNNAPIATHKEMCRHLQPGNNLVVGVYVYIQCIGE